MKAKLTKNSGVVKKSIPFGKMRNLNILSRSPSVSKYRIIRKITKTGGETRALDPSCYEFILNSNFVSLPSNDTLRSFEGSIEAGGVGVTYLIISGLKLERKSLNEKKRMGSLIKDGMTISSEEIYKGNTQTLVGKVKMNGITMIEEDSLANRMLGFVFFRVFYSIFHSMSPFLRKRTYRPATT